MMMLETIFKPINFSKMKTKILITVRGGMIQCISANISDIEITVADYDNLNGDPNQGLFQYYKAMPDDILSENEIEGQIKEMLADENNAIAKAK